MKRVSAGSRRSFASSEMKAQTRYKKYDIELPPRIAELFERISAREAVRSAISEEEPVRPLVDA